MKSTYDKNIIRFPEDGGSRELIGGKAAALAELQTTNLPIPPWFALTTKAFSDSLATQQRRKHRSSRHSPTSRRYDVFPSPTVEKQLTLALKRLCPDGTAVAVRSSAVFEDGESASFAGQYETFLFVYPSDVLNAVTSIWRSSFSKRISDYAQAQQIEETIQPPAVLIQQMVDAQVSGVAFDADPVTGRRDVSVVSAVSGLATDLVSGAASADTFRLDRDGRILERLLTEEGRSRSFDSIGEAGMAASRTHVRRFSRQVITDKHVRAVAAMADVCSRHFHRPQDIEWAIEDDRIHLLQSRPITALGNLPDPEGKPAVWDNTNLVESYGGVTTPLTFSFARRAYEEVYRSFARFMWVSGKTITAYEDCFGAMIGLIRGRMYYNVHNWYRLLCLLPGSKFTWKFHTQMLGLDESLPKHAVDSSPVQSTSERVRDGARFLGAICGLIYNHFTLRRRSRAFYERLNNTLIPPGGSLEILRIDELTDYYRFLEQQLLRKWDAPIINDFFAMIFYGVLKKLVSIWLPDKNHLENALLISDGGVISTEPARRIREMASLAASRPELVDNLISGSGPETVSVLANYPRLFRLFQDYLAKFGDRCLDELKLESFTLIDDPNLLLRSIGQTARYILSSKSPGSDISIPDQRRQIERYISRSLRRHPLRRCVFAWVLKHARARVTGRENLRFERTRAFGMVRRVFVEIGHRFHADGVLSHPRNIFYLELHEILGFVDGTATTTDLEGLAVLRKTNFEQYSDCSPADRFITQGNVNIGHTFQTSDVVLRADSADDSCCGIACSPGRIRGRVRIVKDPNTVDLKGGEILVAERTDPGWVMLFPVCAGVLVERGSVLSHVAIVSRELGIPSIVSLSGVTNWLRDGDLVEMDGSTGRVRRLSSDNQCTSDKNIKVMV